MKHENLGRLITVTKPDLVAQAGHVEDVQLMLHDVARVLQGFAEETMPADLIEAISRLCAGGIKATAEGKAEAAALFIAAQVQQLNDDEKETAK